MVFALADHWEVSNLTPCHAYKSIKMMMEATIKKPMSALLNMENCEITTLTVYDVLMFVETVKITD